MKIAGIHGEIMPTTKPDKTNIEKAIEDGMNRIVFRDDALICDGHFSKRYSVIPGVEVRATAFAARGAR